MKPTVFVPEPIAPGGMAMLREVCDCVAPWEEGRDLSEADQAEALYAADAVIVRLFRVDEPLLERCSNLKVVGKHGVGVDNIDCDAATRRRIPVIYTPTANSNAVAEHTIGLMLALARNIVPASIALRDGHFADRARFGGVELAGKTLGIIGLGRVGGQVARIASAGLGLNVWGYDPFVTGSTYGGPAKLAGSLDELFAISDILSFHVSLGPDTHHLLNDKSLGKLKPGCRIINTSRGAVIDEAALVRALQSGRVAGAALDVFEQEPLASNHPLCQAPNLLMTPHISSSTAEALDRMATDAARGVLDVLAGRPPAHIVNPEVLQ